MLTTGQVLWLKLPFGRVDDISQRYHPYLIINISGNSIKVVEVGQMDSENDHPWEVVQGKKIPIDNKNPDEKVIYKKSYLQTDRKIQIEIFDGLEKYLDTTETLSSTKFAKVRNGYYAKRNLRGTDAYRDLFFTESEIREYNPYPDWERAHIERMKKYF